MKSHALLGQSEIENVLNQAIASTLTMMTMDSDFEVCKIRLQLIRELATGFGIDIDIPSNRKILFKRFKDEIFGGELL